MEVNSQPVQSYWHTVSFAHHYSRLQAELPKHTTWIRGIRVPTRLSTAVHCLTQEPAFVHEGKLQVISEERLQQLICLTWERHGESCEEGEFPVCDQFGNEIITVKKEEVYQTIQAAKIPLEAYATVRHADMLQSQCDFNWKVFDGTPVWDRENRLSKSFLHLFSGRRSTCWFCATSTERIVVARGNCSVAVAVASTKNLHAYTQFKDRDDPIHLFTAVKPVIYYLLAGDVLQFWPGSMYMIIADDPLVLWRTQTNFGQTMAAQLAAMRVNISRGTATPARCGKKLMDMYTTYKWDLDIVQSCCGNNLLLAHHYKALHEAVMVLSPQYRRRRSLTEADFADLFFEIVGRSFTIRLPLDEPNVLKRLLNVDQLARETKSKEAGFRKFLIAVKLSQRLANMQKVWSGAENGMLMVKLFLEMIRLLSLRIAVPVAGITYPCFWLAMRTEYPASDDPTREVRDMKSDMENDIVFSPTSQEAENMLIDLAWQPYCTLPDGIMMLVEEIEKESNGPVSSRTRKHA